MDFMNKKFQNINGVQQNLSKEKKPPFLIDKTLNDKIKSLI